MAQKRSEIAEIRRDLREMRWYVSDESKRKRANEWIEESHEKSDADTAREYIERELNSMLSEYPMYFAPELARAEEGFPEECLDCPHSKGACPVLTDDVERRWRERRLNEADTEEEARRVYEEQAIDVGCSRIPTLLEEWSSEHADFIRRGQRLLDEVEEDLHGDGADDPAATSPFGESGPAIPDGGGS